MKQQPKFKMFDKVITKNNNLTFEIKQISILSNIFYYSSSEGQKSYLEHELEFYVEPKKRIVLYEYLIRSKVMPKTFSSLFYENDEDFIKAFCSYDLPVIKTGRTVEVNES